MDITKFSSNLLLKVQVLQRSYVCKGKVALSINNKFINFEERAKDGISKEDTKASSDGV